MKRLLNLLALVAVALPLSGLGQVMWYRAISSGGGGPDAGGGGSCSTVAQSLGSQSSGDVTAGSSSTRIYVAWSNYVASGYTLCSLTNWFSRSAAGAGPDMTVEIRAGGGNNPGAVLAAANETIHYNYVQGGDLTNATFTFPDTTFASASTNWIVIKCSAYDTTYNYLMRCGDLGVTSVLRSADAVTWTPFDTRQIRAVILSK